MNLIHCVCYLSCYVSFYDTYIHTISIKRNIYKRNIYKRNIYKRYLQYQSNAIYTNAIIIHTYIHTYIHIYAREPHAHPHARTPASCALEGIGASAPPKIFNITMQNSKCQQFDIGSFLIGNTTVENSQRQRFKIIGGFHARNPQAGQTKTQPRPPRANVEQKEYG
jgi:hypothetical protein